jgi:hypothetical protein
MTTEAAPRKARTIDQDPLHGESLTIRILDWPTGHVNITLNDKAGRPVAQVQSTVAHTEHLPISKDDAREWAQAIVYRFNIYEQLLGQLTSARADQETDEAGERTEAKARIDKMADDLEHKIVDAKTAMEQLGREYAKEQARRQLVSAHRDALEEVLADALTKPDTLERK